MKSKVAGLPKWAWIAIIGGGVGVGLYLHSRRKKAEETEETSESESLPGAQPQTLESYEGTNAGGSLQGLGVAGPVPQATVPVESPVVPQGFVDTLGGQQETTQSLANGILESQQATDSLAQALAESPSREIIREQLTGGSHRRKPTHKPPAKHPKKKKKTAA
jgi:uncharacterized membrane protein